MLRVLQIPICHTRKKAKLQRRNGTGVTGAERGDLGVLPCAHVLVLALAGEGA